MDKRCCIKKCNNKSFGGISFHSFPLLEELKQKWLDVVPVSQSITKDSVVCSLHFKPVDFHTVNSRQTLKAGVVPSIFPVTCRVLVQRLPANATKWAVRQPSDFVPIKGISGPSSVSPEKLDPDLNPVITEIKSEIDPIDPNENPRCKDTLIFSDQPSEDPILVTNVKIERLDVSVEEVKVAGSEEVNRLVKVPSAQTPEATSVQLKTGKYSADLSQVSSNREKKHNRHVVNVKRDLSPVSAQPTLDIQTSTVGVKETSDIPQTLLLDVRCISDNQPGSSDVQESSASSKREKKHNRHVLVVKHDLSPVSAQPTSETSTIDVEQTSLLDVRNSTDNRQKSSLSLKRTLDIRERS